MESRGEVCWIKMRVYISKKPENPDLDIANPDPGSKSLVRGFIETGWLVLVCL
jgi:hypothetical protein